MKKWVILIFIQLLILPAKGEGLEEKLNKLQAKLKVSVIIKEEAINSWKQLSYTYSTDTVSLLDYLRLLEKEYLKYPIGYFNKIKLKRIVLVENLTLNEQFRAAVPDPYTGSLFLAIEKPSDLLRYNNYQTHVMHHELHHYAEFSYWRSMSHFWADWKATNDTSFHYKGNGATAYQNLTIDWYQLSHPLNGFINLYSTTAQEEDRAELVALIMGDEELKKMKKQIKNDFILQQKILLIQFLLSEISGVKNGYWKKVIE